MLGQASLSPCAAPQICILAAFTGLSGDENSLFWVHQIPENPSVLKTEREKSQRGHGVPASSWLPLWAQFLQPTGFIDLMLGCPLGPSSAAGKQRLAQTHAGKQCLDTAPWKQPGPALRLGVEVPLSPWPRNAPAEPVTSLARGVNGVIGAVA